MADEHFLPGPGDFSYGLSGAPFFGSYAPPGLDLQGFGMMAWVGDLQLPADSSAAATAHFDSALSSLVSSPAHNGTGDDVAIGDLIGRLGSICNATNSCYSTPLSSPPRGASASAAAFALRGCYPGGAAALEACTGRLSRVASSKSLGAVATPTAALESPELETRTKMGGGTTEAPDPLPPAKGNGGAAPRKRKASGKGKASSSATTAAAANASPKRSKVAVDGGGDDTSKDEDAEAATKVEKPEPEPAKGYIHVRARRGQATDSHSLAERVRRERISERMKMLQSLVPGCNKITGKALMLDEIINYVQSLQRQVEFLSMKLATMNPELEADAQYHQQLPSGKDTMTHQTAMLVCPTTAAAFSSYAADPFVAAHTTHQLDSCASSFLPVPGWEAQDLQSILHHDTAAAAAVHDGRQDLYASPPSPPAPQLHQNSFHGQQQQQQQGAATVSHMKLERA